MARVAEEGGACLDIVALLFGLCACVRERRGVCVCVCERELSCALITGDAAVYLAALQGQDVTGCRGLAPAAVQLYDLQSTRMEL